MTTLHAPAPAGEETRALPLIQRDLQIRANSFNEADNTIEVCFTTGARGMRFDWQRWQYVDEELATDPENVRLDRLNNGGAVLAAHNRYQLEGQIGVVVDGSARMEGGEGLARIRFSAREDLKPLIQDIRDGIIRNISVGYTVFTYEVTESEGQRPLMRAVDWEPAEISFVPVPFDAGSQVRSHEPAQGGHFPCIFRRHGAAQKETDMTQTVAPVPGAPAPVEATRIAPVETDIARVTAPVTDALRSAAVTVSDIRTATRNAGLGDDVAFALIERNEANPMTRTDLMAEIGTRFAERDTPAPVQSRAPAQPGNNVTMARAMEDAVFHRISPGSELSDAGRSFRGMSLLRMAEEMLSSSGMNCRGMAAVEIAERALHSGSDFPALMGSALNRRLRASYEENTPSYRLWARRAPNAPDFKAIDVVQMSAMPDLLKVNEGGEFKYGTASDGKATYSVSTYGRIIGITRQTLINDDLRALDRIVTGFAGSAARLENRTAYAILTANAAMADSVALFHATHGNLAGAGAVIGATTLGAGRAAMRLQKGLANEELNLAPRYLIVPAAQEQLAYQYTSSQFVPAKTTDINEFRSGGRTALEPVVEAVLDGNSTTAWYLAGDTAQVDTIEYCYLEGAEGVQLSNRIGFTVDGVEIKASLDFAAAVIDHRGLYKNPGA